MGGGRRGGGEENGGGEERMGMATPLPGEKGEVKLLQEGVQDSQ